MLASAALTTIFLHAHSDNPPPTYNDTYTSSAYAGLPPGSHLNTLPQCAALRLQPGEVVLQVGLCGIMREFRKMSKPKRMACVEFR